MRLWYLVYTKPRSERIVEHVLLERGMEIFLPMVQVWRVRRKRIEEEPMFPNYIFVRCDLTNGDFAKVRWAPGVRYLVSFDGSGPISVPDDLVEYIKGRSSNTTMYDKYHWKKGDKVRIVDGAFKGLEAVFDARLPGYERARVLIKVLGRLTRCEVPVEWLDKP